MHAYWLLDEPYLIDDADEPPAVEIEWVERVGGKREPRKFILEDGERVYLDRERSGARLSRKATHFQDVCAGVAEKIGGDATHDLARLLRLPGTLNHKNQRNGDEPVETELLVCDADRRYALQDFERFKGESKLTKRSKQIAAIPLPRPRKPCATVEDKLADLIAVCSMAEPGTRSEADFALSCFAIRKGVARDELLPRVQTVGKFAEGGERYFDRTWRRAEDAVRSEKYELLQKNLSKPAVPSSSNSGAQSAQELSQSDDAFDAFYSELISGGEPSEAGATITVDGATPTGTVMRRITDAIVGAGDYYQRGGQLVRIVGDDVASILTCGELSGALNTFVEFYYLTERTARYGPLKPDLATCWLNNHVEQDRLQRISLFTRTPGYTPDFKLLEPGYDAATGIYYAGERVEPIRGTEHLDRLLKDFCFLCTADRTNYIASLLTGVLIPLFVGAKPAWLLNGNQPGLGKTMLAQVNAILRDGRSTESISYNPNDEEFEKRLGALVRRGATTILVDNAKQTSKAVRIDSPCLERSITDEVLSFRLLGSSTEIRAENSHLFFITANTTAVSRDLISRSVVVNLKYEGNPERRRFSLTNPEEYAREHRAALLGELLGMVELWKASGHPQADVENRFSKRGWGAIVGGILEANNEPDFLANADEASVALDDSRRDFAELVAVLSRRPQGIWRAQELVKEATKHRLLQDELGDGSDHSKASKMGLLAGRYLAERFDLGGGTLGYLERDADRNGKLYRLGIEKND